MAKYTGEVRPQLLQPGRFGASREGGPESRAYVIVKTSATATAGDFEGFESPLTSAEVAGLEAWEVAPVFLYRPDGSR